MNINEISMNIMKTRKSYKTPTTASKHQVKCKKILVLRGPLLAKATSIDWKGMRSLCGGAFPGRVAFPEIRSRPDVGSRTSEIMQSKHQKWLKCKESHWKNNNVASTEGLSQCPKAPKCLEMQWKLNFPASRAGV